MPYTEILEKMFEKNSAFKLKNVSQNETQHSDLPYLRAHFPHKLRLKTH